MIYYRIRTKINVRDPGKFTRGVAKPTAHYISVKILTSFLKKF